MRVSIAQYAGIDADGGLPLAAGLLVATARRDSWLTERTDFHIEVERQPLPAAVAALRSPHLLGLSLYPWNARYALAVAAAVRAAHPTAFIVAGGPSVPRAQDAARAVLAANSALDALLPGEGERAFRALLRARQGHGDLAQVPGLIWRDQQGTRNAGPPSRVEDFTATGSPYLDGTFDELLQRHPQRFSMAVCETNRGCPFTCSFCDWSATTQLVEYPLARVLAEIDWVADSGLSNLCFTDANFGIRPRDPEIAMHLAQAKQRSGTPRGCYFYLTKNDHRRNLATIECFQSAGIEHCVGLAVQDFDEDVLAATGRDTIHSVESRRLGAICAERGIPTHNELILGLPAQSYASLTRTVLEAMVVYAKHRFRIFLCRLISDSELAGAESRRHHGIDSRCCRWLPTDGDVDAVVEETQEIVVATNTLPLADWQRSCRFAFFAAAGYNQQLLRVPLRFLADNGVDRQHWLEALCDAMAPGSGFTCYESIGVGVQRLLDSMLAGDALALPLEGHGTQRHELAETITVLALADAQAFYQETAAISRHCLGDRVDGALFEESLRFQHFCTPQWPQVAASEATFDHDWLDYLHDSNRVAPQLRTTRLRFAPPSFAVVSERGRFSSLFLSCTLAGVSTGELSRLSVP